jgi:hypothetical protein
MASYEDAAKKAKLNYTYIGSGENSRLVWSSIRSGSFKRSEPLGEIYARNAQGMLGAPAEELGIYRSVSPGNWFGSSPQKTIENLLSVRPGDNVFMMDIENLGTFGGKGSDSLPWYSPTEIAIGQRKVSSNYTFERMPKSKEVSLLVRPTDNVFAHIDSLLQKVASNGYATSSLSKDERRTLNDLILYGDDDPFGNGYFSKGKNGATYLNRQLRDKQAPTGFIFTPDQVKRMHKGRTNLSYGSSPEQVVSELARVIGGRKNAIIGGANIDAYDIPMMKDYLMNHLNPLVTSPKQQKELTALVNSFGSGRVVDNLQIFRTFFRNQASIFGKNLKQEQVADMLGISKGVAHTAIDDLNTSADIFNKLVSSQNLIGPNGIGVKGPLSASWDRTPFKMGDSLFSVSGMSSFEASRNGKFDMVYKRDEKGQLVPVYENIKPNPIYKNTAYTLEKTVKDFQIDGKSHFGAVLRNQTPDGEDLYHMIFRESEDELRSVFGQHFIPMDHLSEIERKTLQGNTMADRARRRWDRLFSPEGGVTQIKRMIGGVEAEAAGKSPEEVRKALGYMDNKGVFQEAKPEFVRDYQLLKKRVAGEKDHILDFISELEKSPLQGDSSSAKYAQGVALKNYRKIIDAEFGGNTMEVQLPDSQKVIPIKMDGEIHNISLKDPASVESGIKRVVGSGYDMGKPSMRITKKRLKTMIDELRTKGRSGLTGSAAKEMYRLIDRLDDHDSLGTLYTEIAGRIHQEHTYEQAKGLNGMGMSTMTVEDPFNVNPLRAQKIRSGYGGKRASIHQRAILPAVPFRSNSWQGQGLINPTDSIFNQMIQTHDKVFNNILESTGAKNSSLVSQGISETLTDLARAFSSDDVAVGFVYDEKHKGLVMALTNKKQAAEIFSLKGNEIIEHSKVAAIKVPLLNEKNNVFVPGQERSARLMTMEMSTGRNRGKLMLGSGVDVVSQQLIRSSKKIKDLVLQGRAPESESWGNNIVRQTIGSLSMNNKYMSEDGLTKEEARKSLRAKRLRTGQIDVAGLAKSWYADQYGSEALKKKEYEASSKFKGSFLDSLNMKERRKFDQEAPTYASKLNLHINFQNVKDTLAANNILSAVGVDARQDTPFGFWNSMTQENIQKSVNYLPLDRNRVVDGLSRGGKSADQISRYLTPGLVTDVGKNIYDQELAYLSTRTAYIDDSQLKGMMEKTMGKSNPMMTTYDGMVLVRESYAKGLVTSRESRIRMAEGANIDRRLMDMLGTEIGEDGIIRVKETLTESERDIMSLLDRDNRIGSPTKGHITVGALMKDDKVRESYRYNGRSEKAIFKGLDTTNNSLIFEELQSMSDGVKIISEAGHRVTARVASDEILNALGIEADVVLPKAKFSKEQYGSFVNSKVRLVIDEAQKQIDKQFTVGDVKRVEAMDNAMGAIRGFMTQHFGLSEGDVKLSKGQLIMNSNLGANAQGSFNLQSVQNFLSEFDKEENKWIGAGGFLKNTIEYGQESFGNADVYNWENSMGATFEGRFDPRTGRMKKVESIDGLVSWGIKETGAISDRADRFLGEGNAVSSWVNKHVSAAARAQNRDIDGYARNLISASLDLTDTDLQQKGILREGEVVIRTRGDSFHINDRDGIRAGRINNGITEISAHTFTDPPQSGYKGQTRTVGDYSNTVIQMGGEHVELFENGKATGKKMSDAIRQNGGTALFELPGDNFGRKYVRFFDSHIASVPINADESMAVLTDLQKAQIKIASKSKEYQAAQTPETETALRNAISNYDEQVRYEITSSKGSIAKKLLTSQQDMSGRFRAQTVNPLASGNFKEGSLYVSEQRMLEMIDGAEDKVLRATNAERHNVLSTEWKEANKNLKTSDRIPKNMFMREAALAEIKEKGLYGFVNRYPTIHESTNAVLKVEVSNELTKANARTGLFTVGTATSLNADYDGDFISNVLAHYKYQEGAEVHQAMAKIHQGSLPEFEAVAKEVRSDIESKASAQGVTVQELWRSAEFRKEFHEQWAPKVGPLQDAETAIARLGKADVGVLDNTRYKLSSLIYGVKETLKSGGMLTEERSAELSTMRSHLDDFGRAVSQKAISSKKFKIEDFVQSYIANNEGATLEAAQEYARTNLIQRDAALEDLKGGINRPDGDGIERIRKANSVLGIFDTASGAGFTPTDAQPFEFEHMLDSLQKTGQYTGRSRGLFNDVSDKLFVSEGIKSPEDLSNMLRGKGTSILETPGMQHLINFDPRIAESLEKPLSYSSKALASNLEEPNMGSLLRESQATPLSEELLGGATTAKNSGEKVRELADRFAAGFGGGGSAGFGTIRAAGLVFGGLWAASAITRGGPTPEETVRGKDGVIEESMPRGSAMGMLDKSPTARVTPNEDGEHINISINSKQASTMSEQQIAALVHGELNAMMPMQLNMNMNVQDNTTNLDQQWLQGIVSQAISGGRIIS